MKTLISLISVLVLTLIGVKGQFQSLKTKHEPQLLSVKQIEKLALLSNNRHLIEVLDEILVPRVVGTPNHEKVFNFIVSELSALKYAVEIDEFKEKTPIFDEKLTFRNIIATPNPKAERYLVLACHYDSKYFPGSNFVGATDSAVPCAIMLNLAKILSSELATESSLSLMLIFFDGEEAFKQWDKNDSIYGARHLARKWQDKEDVASGKQISFLDRIDVLVLLDLIGAKKPQFYSYFQNTDKWFLRLAEAEQTLGDLGLLPNWRENQSYFVRRRGFDGIEDDHIPFLKRNVPILHLIATPFPKEWHTLGDNRNIIDIDTVENISKILRVFLAEYLHLTISHSSNHNGNIPGKEL